jgi:ribosome-binding factor A
MTRPYTTRRLPVDSVQATRKKLQLCRQVQHALMWALGSAHSEDVLAYCGVEAVEPLPGGNRLLVKISVPADISLATVSERLGHSARTLRAEVAQAITRRKVPELLFLPVPER